MNLELAKERVVQELCAHYAQDHLSTGELESRFERVNQSHDHETLLTVLDGLPAVGPLVAPPPALRHLTPQPGEVAHWDASGRDGRALSRRERQALDERNPPQRYAAVFSQITKEGHWTPAPRIQATACLGGVTLDLRDADIPDEGIHMEVNSWMGEMKIILPPGVGADVDCTAVMAEVSDKAKKGAPGAPRVRVTGGAVMGNIVVVTKLPRSSGMESWRGRLKQWFGSEGA